MRSALTTTGVQFLREGEALEREGYARKIEGVISIIESDEHHKAGYSSIQQYVSSVLDCSTETAGKLIADAKESRFLAPLRKALDAGEISVDQFRAIAVIAHDTEADGTRWANTLTSEVWIENLWQTPIKELQREARKARARVLERKDGGVYFRMYPTKDERYMRGEFQLEPADGAVVLAAVDARVPFGTKLRDFERAEARGLVEVCADPGGSGQASRPLVMVAVSHDTLVGADGAETIASVGHGLVYIDDATAEQLACDAQIQPVVVDENGTIIATGPITEYIPKKLRNAVLERDNGTCNQPDCDRTTYLHIHHVVPRKEGGPTTLPNLRPLCWEHHDWAHRPGGWKLVHTGTGSDVTWIKPDSTPYHSRK